MSHSSIRLEVKLALIVTVLMLGSMWTYYGATDNSLVWDSSHYLISYRDHFSSLSVENLWWMLTSLEFGNWHPLTWFSWAIDYQVYGGLSPWGYHLSNIIFHSINTVLVFILVLVVFGLTDSTADNFSPRKDNNSLTAAFLASLLFAVHPQHVESVAWIAERKDLLFQLFLLLSLLAYVKYVTCSQLARARWYFTTIGLFFFAVLSKPMAVTFPVVLLLIDIYPLRRTSLVTPLFSAIRQKSFLSLLVEKTPFLLLSVLLIVMTLIAQETAISKVAHLHLVTRVVNAFHSTIFYLESFLLPVSLSPHYSYFQVVGILSALKALTVMLMFSVITLAAVVRWRKQKPALLIAWFFYLVTLSPVLGLIQVGSQGAADRYAYFPTLPFYVLIAGGIFLILNGRDVVRKTILLLSFTVIVCFFVFQTGRQIHVWKSDFSLWTHAIGLDSENGFAHNNLGIAYMNYADYEKAAIEFELVGNGTSVPYLTLARRAMTYMYLDRFEEAIEYLVKFGSIAGSSPDLNVDTPCVQYNIGWSFAQLKMYQESIDLFNRVSQDSNLGPDANTWLLALQNAGNQHEVGMVKQGLPGFCENLIPSRAQVQRIQ